MQQHWNGREGVQRARRIRTACLSALTCAGLSAAASAQVVLTAGDDGWITPPGGTFADFSDPCPAIPADFFEPGSPPWMGVIPFAGVPLDTSPPGILGPQDTIVRRTADTIPLGIGGSDTVPIEIVALSLESTAPITVPGFGDWDVRVCLSEVVAQPTGGSMFIMRDCDDGGGYSATLEIIPKFVFTRIGDGAVAVMDPAPLKSLTGGCEWALVGGPGGFDPLALGLWPIPPGTGIDGDCNGSFEATAIGDSNFRPGIGGACVGPPPVFMPIFCSEAAPCSIHQIQQGSEFVPFGEEKSLLITEICDGTLPGGQPKWVEITNTGTLVKDLSLYSLGNYNNGSIFLGGGGSTSLSGNLAPGQSYLIGYEADPGGPGLSEFFQVYGFELDFYMGGGFINGDDVVALFFGSATGTGSDATMVDVYGELGTDGTGEVWETTDSYGVRCNDEANCGFFEPGEWDFPGANALEAGCGGDDVCEAANHVALTTPGVHAGCASQGSFFCDGSAGNCPGGAAGNVGAGCPHGAGPNGAGGCVLTPFGNAQFSNDTYGFTVTSGPSSLGILIQGATALNYPNGNPNVPDSAGLFCLVPQQRGNVEVMDMGVGSDEGVIDDFKLMPFGATAQPMGSTTYNQFWFRDNMNPNANPGPNVEFNFSNGVETNWIN